MRYIDEVYINGVFRQAKGTEDFDLHNPATAKVIGRVRLGNASDSEDAIAAAKAAFPAFSQTTKAERIDFLRRLAHEMRDRSKDLLDAVVGEYGAPRARATFMVEHAANNFDYAAETLETYEFTHGVGNARVTMLPLGVVGVITPWNANPGFICNKLAMVIASGSTCVIKPSEMSAMQTQIVTEALHAAGLPAGVFNVVNGRGDVVGATLSSHPDVAKISFTGSTVTGRSILKAAADTFKRVTLELGGKSPTIILDDADFSQAVPLSLSTGYMNSGQACIAGTRILVPAGRLAAFEDQTRSAVDAIKSGDPLDPETSVGPMVSERQWDRVQSYIQKGLDEGATLLAGGLGRPEGAGEGWFVKPTVFTNVRNDMTIAREEIFGPVLTIISYEDDDDAVAIANDTDYGLHAYVIGKDEARVLAVADRLVAGRVIINGAPMEMAAPFGGFKHSGIGRENGVMGLEAYLEPRAVMS